MHDIYLWNSPIDMLKLCADKNTLQKYLYYKMHQIGM